MDGQGRAGPGQGVSPAGSWSDGPKEEAASDRRLDRKLSVLQRSGGGQRS